VRKISLRNGSDVPAWLGLKARALAWLRWPVAWQIPSQGRGPRPWLGLAWLWLRPRLRAIYIKNNYIYIIYHNLRVLVFERVRESGGG